MPHPRPDHEDRIIDLAILTLTEQMLDLRLPLLPTHGSLVVVAIVVISLGVHEAAHAWVALKCGDPTARDLGRITLNPLAHIDPFLTVLLPTLLYLTTGFLFGGARPVPVNFHKLRHPYRDMALVALAGPISNFLIGLLLLLVLKVTVVDLELLKEDFLGHRILIHAVYWNLVLAAFNLLPIPPLDGSRVLTWLLPASLRPAYMGLERIGILLVIGFVWFVPQGRVILFETIRGLVYAAEYVVTLGGLW